VAARPGGSGFPAWGYGFGAVMVLLGEYFFKLNRDFLGQQHFIF
jgi:hypothetical protein